MKVAIEVLVAGLILASAGCGTLIPKRVELFQDKVREFPEAKSSEREVQRQAAQRAADGSLKTFVLAISKNASTNIIQSASNAAVLAGAVSRSLGPPVKPSSEPALELARRLDTAVAKQNARVDDFKQDNNVNAGKKIEDTGLFKIPYFVWLGGVVFLVFVGLIVAGVIWTALKMWAMANPPVALGLNAVQAGAGFIKNAFSQVLKGGEKFKAALSKEVQDPALQERIKELFRVSQQTSQDEQVQAVIRELTK